MSKLLFILSVCFGSLAVGYIGQITLLGRHIVTYDAIKSASDRMKIFSLVCLLPIPIMHSFWKITFSVIFSVWGASWRAFRSRSWPSFPSCPSHLLP